jgi:hypothetical protein
VSSTYQITTDQDDILIRLPRRFIDETELVKLLDYLELEAIRRRSQLTESDAATLAAEVRQAAWQQVKHLFKES